VDAPGQPRALTRRKVVRAVTAAPVVVGVDGSEESRLALRWAVDYAQMSGAPVEAVIAWEIPPAYGLAPSYDDARTTVLPAGGGHLVLRRQFITLVSRLVNVRR
jgi:nucleotide-binding universal stress UspA family protein